MKRVVAAFALFWSGGTSAQPFIPPSGAVDYVVTMTRPRGEPWQVYHRRGSSRIDTRSYGRLDRTRFFTPEETTAADISWLTGGKVLSFQIRRGKEQFENSRWNHESFPTGERREIAGEACEVWNVARGPGGPVDPGDKTKLSCVTDDGIELWSQVMGTRFSEPASAVKVERRPVDRDEVRPPRSFFSLQTWLDAWPHWPSRKTPPGDFETFLESGQTTGKPGVSGTRTVRHHHPWTMIDDRLRDGRRMLRVEHAATAMMIRFEGSTKTPYLSLRIERNTPDAQHGTPVPKALGRKETILGERCNWYEASDSWLQAAIPACRTPDGITLKASIPTSTWSTKLQAIRLQRRSVDPAEIISVLDVLDGRNWGGPD